MNLEIERLNAQAEAEKEVLEEEKNMLSQNKTFTLSLTYEKKG